MAPDRLKCHFDLWKSLVPKGARVRIPPVSNVFFDSFISFLTIGLFRGTEATEGWRPGLHAGHHRAGITRIPHATRVRFSIFLTSDSRSSVNANSSRERSELHVTAA